MLRSLVVLTLVLAAASPALAGGYIVDEIDSAVSGRGGTGVAASDSPSAIFFNPANLVPLDGLHLQAGFAALAPDYDFEPQGDGEPAGTEAQPLVPPNVSVSYALGDAGLGKMTGGIGLYAPYAADTVWPDEWVGADAGQSFRLQVYEIAPAIGLRPSEMFAVGAAVRILPGEYTWQHAEDVGGGEGDVDLSGSATEVGFTAGVSIWGFENLAIGLSWRSPIVMRFRGDSTTTAQNGETLERPVRLRLRLPQVLRIGARYQIFEELLSASVDLELQQWSALKKIPIKLENADGTDTVASVERNATDSVVFRLGVELTPISEVTVRLGYVFDERMLPDEFASPVPPDGDEHSVTAGVSYRWDDWLGIHAHFVTSFLAPRTADSDLLAGRFTGGYGDGVVSFGGGLTVSAAFDVGPLITEPLFEPVQDQWPSAPVEPDGEDAGEDDGGAGDATGATIESEPVEREPAPVERSPADRAPVETEPAEGAPDDSGTEPVEPPAPDARAPSSAPKAGPGDPAVSAPPSQEPAASTPDAGSGDAGESPGGGDAEEPPPAPGAAEGTP